MSVRPIALAACLLMAGLLNAGETAAVKASPEAREADKKALMPVANFVGEWRGVGSMKGSGGSDAWSEESEWTWDFKGGRGALVMLSPKGKFYTEARLEPGAKPGSFKLTAKPSTGKGAEEFAGEFNKEGDLVMDNTSAPADRPSRLTFSLVAKGKRMVVLYQKKERKDTYMPIAELGSTLKGSGFGKFVDEHECVVTGGRGKSTVDYKGKSYWVCCGGCRDSFLENPEKEIAAFMKRKEEEKLKK